MGHGPLGSGVTAWSGGPSAAAREKESARLCVAGQWACGVLTSGPKDARKGAARGRRVLVVDRSAGRGCGVRTQRGCLPGGVKASGSGWDARRGVGRAGEVGTALGWARGNWPLRFGLGRVGSGREEWAGAGLLAGFGFEFCFGFSFYFSFSISNSSKV